MDGSSPRAADNSGPNLLILQQQMIKEVSISEFHLRLTKPFTYATLTMHELPYALVKITDESGNIGYGEAAASWDVNGETPTGVVAFNPIIQRLLADQQLNSVNDVSNCLSIVSREVAYNSALKSGIEAALLDLLGKKVGKNVLKLLGGKPKSITSQRIISMADYDAVLKGETDKKLIGATFVKVKSNANVEKAISVLKYIRQKFPQIKMTIDANQSWGDYNFALERVKKVEPYKIEWIEQPCLADDLESLKKLTKESPIPVMLDESICDYRDTVLNLEAGCGKLINIKLAKCGGIMEAVKIAAWCDEHKFGYMIGDMIHSQLGAVTNLYAGALSNPMIHDQNDPERISEDPTSGVIYDPATNSFLPPTGSGLGIEVKK